jgi:hypothetical protein
VACAGRSAGLKVRMARSLDVAVADLFEVEPLDDEVGDVA